MDTTKYTMTPEQISRLFKFSVDAILRHIHKGYWNGKGIYAKTTSGQYRINPDAFGRWYRQMTEESSRQEHNKKTIKTLRTRAVMVWIVVVVAFGLLGTTDSGGFLRGAIGISFIATIVVFIGYVIAANIFLDGGQPANQRSVHKEKYVLEDVDVHHSTEPLMQSTNQHSVYEEEYASDDVDAHYSTEPLYLYERFPFAKAFMCSDVQVAALYPVLLQLNTPRTTMKSADLHLISLTSFKLRK